MRIIERTTAFKKDFKREMKGRYKETVCRDLPKIIELLICDKPLLKKHCDHALAGNRKTYRDCHIRPDLLLIYQKRESNTLILVRLGSHTELGIK